jgi:chemotaxis response regulator CheB
MSTQKIILLNGSHFITDMLKRIIAKTPGLQIMADVEDSRDYSRIIQEIVPDWIILVLQPGEEVADSVNHILLKNASIHLLIVEADGRRVKIKWFEPHELELRQKNLHEILQILVQNKPTEHLKEAIQD